MEITKIITEKAKHSFKLRDWRTGAVYETRVEGGKNILRMGKLLKKIHSTFHNYKISDRVRENRIAYLSDKIGDIERQTDEEPIGNAIWVHADDALSHGLHDNFWA